MLIISFQIKSKSDSNQESGIPPAKLTNSSTYINFEEKVSNEIRENYSDIAVLFAHKVGCNCGCLG